MRGDVAAVRGCEPKGLVTWAFLLWRTIRWPQKAEEESGQQFQAPFTIGGCHESDIQGGSAWLACHGQCGVGRDRMRHHAFAQRVRLRDPV
jgi:hypothetical protein